MVVHAYYPLGEPRVQREARAALGQGYEVSVLCLRQPGEAAREMVDGIDVHRLRLTHIRGAGLKRTALQYVAFTALATLVLARAALRRTFDVVQIHTPPDFLVAAGVLPKLRGSRLLLDIHDLSSHMYGARFSGPWVALVSQVLGFVELLACRLADAVVTVHLPYKRQLIAHGVESDKVTVVMNSVDDDLVGQAQAATGPRGPSPNSFLLAYHGTLTEWYGVDLLLEAMAKLEGRRSDLYALILGDGDALSNLRGVAQKRGLMDRVEFSGRYLPIEETLARVAPANCGVIPNRASTLNRFALSSKLFEYVSLGIPVVVARLETLAAHFGPDEVTFFAPGSADGLAEAILWVAEHPDEARAKAQRAKERAREYSWHSNRDRYLALLSSS